ncbi:uncharacterized threonine-rich GPI-anchored glycoprotein PJ4664.02-like [Haliotis rubra]|uniref:uncharacterized threonine-rich GPI-anchored glycoprotein PJ4664.02-like n=1 Tax=Haliotis rubra TaxID=36100 RepID=UPI001EE5E692|nr:uncharacterized threonine-rich GPI-anchored glycoprotein PJ4664.02-like [Haliotis rubra]
MSTPTGQRSQQRPKRSPSLASRPHLRRWLSEASRQLAHLPCCSLDPVSVGCMGFFNSPVRNNNYVPVTSVTILNATTSPLSARENDVITLVCETNPTLPPSAITWMKDNETLTDAVTSYTTGRGKTVTRSILTLRATCSDHMPDISCTASINDTFLTSPKLKMSVQCDNVPLNNLTFINFTSSPMPVVEGDVISFTCRTNPTRPPSTMNWMMIHMPSAQLATSQTTDVHVPLTNVSLYHVSTNGQRLTGSENGLVVSDANPLAVVEGDVIRLMCETNPTRPPSTIYWTMDNQNLTQAETYDTLDVLGRTVTTSILSLNVVCSDTMPEIYCTASDDDYIVTSNLTLAVRCRNAPVTSVRILNATTNPMAIAENDTITLVCETNPTRPPSNIVWMMANQALLTQPVTSQRNYLGKTVSISILTLNPTCSDDMQEIACIASNNISRRSSRAMKMAVQCSTGTADVPLTTVTIQGTTGNVLPVSDKEKLRLQCETNPTSQKSSLIWMKDNQTVTQEVESHTRNVGSLTLTFSILTLIATCDDNLSPISCTATNENRTLTSSKLRMIVNCPTAMESSDGFQVGVGVGVGVVAGLLLLVAVSVFILWKLRSKSLRGKGLPNVSNGSTSSYMTKHDTSTYDNRLMARSEESERNNTNTEMNTFSL